MTQNRANDIERSVFYPFLSMIPADMDANDAFQVGRMIGMMQERLKQELSNEIILKPCMEVREGKDDD